MTTLNRKVSKMSLNSQEQEVRIHEEPACTVLIDELKDTGHSAWANSRIFIETTSPVSRRTVKTLYSRRPNDPSPVLSCMLSVIRQGSTRS